MADAGLMAGAMSGATSLLDGIDEGAVTGTPSAPEDARYDEERWLNAIDAAYIEACVSQVELIRISDKMGEMGFMGLKMRAEDKLQAMEKAAEAQVDVGAMLADLDSWSAAASRNDASLREARVAGRVTGAATAAPVRGPVSAATAAATAAAPPPPQAAPARAPAASSRARIEELDDDDVEEVAPRSANTNSYDNYQNRWDKFDVEKWDAEIEAKDLKEQQAKEVAKSRSEAERLRAAMDAPAPTPTSDVEAEFLADQEKAKGNECFKQAEYAEAVGFYSRALTLVPQPSAVLFNNRAMAYLRLKDPASALADCDSALGIDGTNQKAMYRRGLSNRDLENWDAAAHDLRIALRSNPSSKQILKELAEVERHLSSTLGSAPKAAAPATAAAKATPSPKKTDGFRRIKVIDDGEEESAAPPPAAAPAKKKGMKSIKVEEVDTAPASGLPAAADAIGQGLALKKKGNEDFKNGHFDAAISCYNEALAILPSDHAATAKVFRNRAACHQQNREYGLVVADCTSALAVDPTHVRALIQRGFALESLENYQAALDDMQAALRIEPSAQQASKAAQRLRKSIATKAKVDEAEGRGKPEPAPKPAAKAAPAAGQLTLQQARDACTAAGDAFDVPANASELKAAEGDMMKKMMTALHIFAPILSMHGFGSDLPGAMSFLQAVQVHAGGDEEVEGLLAYLKSCAGMPGAAPGLRRPKKAAASAARAGDAAALKQKGNEALKAKKVAEAIQCYTEALECCTDEALRCDLLNNRAQAHIKARDWQRAETDAANVLQVDTGNMKALYRRGQARIELRLLDDAITDLTRVTQINPSNKNAPKELERAKSLLVTHADAAAEKQAEADAAKATSRREDVQRKKAAAAKAASDAQRKTAAPSPKKLPAAARSAGEFERTFKRLKADPPMQLRYLLLLKAENLPKFFRSALTCELLAAFVECLCLSEAETTQIALQYMQELGKTNRVSMAVMSLTREEGKRLAELVVRLDVGGKQSGLDAFR